MNNINRRNQYEAECRHFVEAFTAFHPILSEFILNQKNQRVGVVVSFVENGKIHVGCSLCNVKRDKFSNYVGLNYAISRGSNDVNDLPKVPRTCKAHVLKMIDRAGRYFKNAA
jgi:hypothetical protein